MKHIGILAHSFEGAALCYRTMCLEGVVRLGPHLHPEITLTGVAMQHMMPAYEAGDYQAVRRMFLHDIDKLAAADADFFVCPDNTAHIALESDDLRSPFRASTSGRSLPKRRIAAGGGRSAFWAPSGR